MLKRFRWRLRDFFPYWKGHGTAKDHRGPRGIARPGASRWERFRAWVAPTRKDLRVEIVERQQTELAWDGRVASSEFSYAVPSKARYLFCAMSEDMEDIDAVALLPDGKRLIDNSPDWYPCLDVAAGENDVVRFVVLRQANKPVPVSIIVLQAVQ